MPATVPAVLLASPNAHNSTTTWRGRGPIQMDMARRRLVGPLVCGMWFRDADHSYANKLSESDSEPYAESGP